MVATYHGVFPLVWLNQGGPPSLLFSNCGFPRVCTVVFPRVCTVVFSYSTVVLVCLQFLGPAHVDLFTQLSNNKFCSIVTHIHHHKTCSVTTHAQSHLMLRTRMAAKRKWTEKMPSLLVVVAVAVLMLQ